MMKATPTLALSMRRSVVFKMLDVAPTEAQYAILQDIPEHFYDIPTWMSNIGEYDPENDTVNLVPHVVLINRDQSKLYVTESLDVLSEDQDRVVGVGSKIYNSPEKDQAFAAFAANQSLSELVLAAGLVDNPTTRTALQEAFQTPVVLYTVEDRRSENLLGLVVMVCIDETYLAKQEGCSIGQWMTPQEIAVDMTSGKIRLNQWSKMIMHMLYNASQQSVDTQSSVA